MVLGTTCAGPLVGAWSMEQGALPGSELRLWRWPLLEGGLASGSAEFAPKH